MACQIIPIPEWHIELHQYRDGIKNYTNTWMVYQIIPIPGWYTNQEQYRFLPNSVISFYITYSGLFYLLIEGVEDYCCI
jgi:hypothetical protein